MKLETFSGQIDDFIQSLLPRFSAWLGEKQGITFTSILYSAHKKFYNKVKNAILTNIGPENAG